MEENSTHDSFLVDSITVLKTIQEIQEEFIVSDDSSTAFNKILEKLLYLTQSEYGFIGEVKYQNGTPFLQTHAITNIAWSDETKKFYADNVSTGLKFYNLKSLFGEVITTQKYVIANDPTHDPRRTGLPKGHPEMRCFVGIPIIKGGQLLGMVGLANKPHGYHEKNIEDLGPFLATCASLIISLNVHKDKKKADSDLIESNEKLRSLNKMLLRNIEDLRQFNFAISHDFHAPLRHISTYTNLIREESKGSMSNEMHENIMVIENSSKKLQQMFDSLLQYTNLEIVNREKVEIVFEDLMLDVLSHFSETLKSIDGTIKYTVSGSLVSDLFLLDFILTQLIDNAIKFRCAQRKLKIEISCELLNEYFILRVKDNGVGINSQNLDRIFKIFKKCHTQKNISGVGAGLAIVKKAVDILEGQIQVNSIVDQGSEFILFIPSYK